MPAKQLFANCTELQYSGGKGTHMEKTEQHNQPEIYTHMGTELESTQLRLHLKKFKAQSRT